MSDRCVRGSKVNCDNDPLIWLDLKLRLDLAAGIDVAAESSESHGALCSVRGGAQATLLK
jgi:hypothetical protein